MVEIILEVVVYQDTIVPFHLMGSFECAGTSINFKSQGLVDFTSPGLQWYHQSMNIFQIWEYEKG